MAIDFPASGPSTETEHDRTNQEPWESLGLWIVNPYNPWFHSGFIPARAICGLVMNHRRSRNQAIGLIGPLVSPCFTQFLSSERSDLLLTAIDSNQTEAESVNHRESVQFFINLHQFGLGMLGFFVGFSSDATEMDDTWLV